MSRGPDEYWAEGASGGDRAQTKAPRVETASKGSKRRTPEKKAKDVNGPHGQDEYWAEGGSNNIEGR
eukprot:3828555-Pyramimonas_sp.AAC.1